MFDANEVAAIGIGPARDVARRKNPGRAGFEKRIHHHAAIDVQARGFGKLQSAA